MFSQSKGDPYCLDCHWENFHPDGSNAWCSLDPNQPPQWVCPDNEQHTSLGHCELDEECCDVDDCSMNCQSFCDGSVDCDPATACSVSHCDDTNCKDTGPACFDDHFHGNDGTDNGLGSLLGLESPFSFDANDLLSLAAADQSQVEQLTKTAACPVPSAQTNHSVSNYMTLPSNDGSHCDHDYHHLHCQNLAGFLPAGQNPVSPSDPTQCGVNPADVFHMLGMCPDISNCQNGHHHRQEDHNCQSNVGKLNSTPSACLYPIPNTQLKGSLNQGTHGPVQLSCRTQHRCQGHSHARAHPYALDSPNSRSSVSSHWLSTPSETPPPLDGGTPVLTSPGFSPTDAKSHICKWITNGNGVGSTCGASFADASSLQEHLITKHLSTVDGPQGNGYYCRWAGCHRPDEPFSQRSKLQGHFLTHSNRMLLGYLHCAMIVKLIRDRR